MKRAKRLSIADIIIVVIIICTALAGVIFITSSTGSGEKVQISVKGEVYKTVSLKSDEKQEIKINDTNVLVIENGSAYMQSAECDDKVCVNKGAISLEGESIVCLPNEVVVEIIADSGVEDAVW